MSEIRERFERDFLPKYGDLWRSMLESSSSSKNDGRAPPTPQTENRGDFLDAIYNKKTVAIAPPHDPSSCNCCQPPILDFEDTENENDDATTEASQNLNSLEYENENADVEENNEYKDDGSELSDGDDDDDESSGDGDVRFDISHIVDHDEDDDDEEEEVKAEASTRDESNNHDNDGDNSTHSSESSSRMVQFDISHIVESPKNNDEMFDNNSNMLLSPQTPPALSPNLTRESNQGNDKLQQKPANPFFSPEFFNDGPTSPIEESHTPIPDFAMNSFLMNTSTDAAAGAPPEKNADENETSTYVVAKKDEATFQNKSNDASEEEDDNGDTSSEQSSSGNTVVRFDVSFLATEDESPPPSATKPPAKEEESNNLKLSRRRRASFLDDISSSSSSSADEDEDEDDEEEESENEWDGDLSFDGNTRNKTANQRKNEQPDPLMDGLTKKIDQVAILSDSSSSSDYDFDLDSDGYAPSESNDEENQNKNNSNPKPAPRPTPSKPGMSKAAFARQRESLTQTLFQKLNTSAFSNKLSKVDITWSSKLRKTAGQTRLKRNKMVMRPGVPLERLASIELSTKVLDNEERLESTLLHEMVHAAAWIIDGVAKPPHGDCFKTWARIATAKTGIKVTTTHDYEIQYTYAWVSLRSKTRRISPKQKEEPS
jgi:predicted SprT family Zn-dependent metalloprotease